MFWKSSANIAEYEDNFCDTIDQFELIHVAQYVGEIKELCHYEGCNHEQLGVGQPSELQS